MEVKMQNPEMRVAAAPKPIGNSSAEGAARTEATVKNMPEIAGKDKEQNNSKLSREDAEHITREMNKFFQLIDANLQFAMHEKTKQLMVQVVDTKENKVLREFPSHELLDTMANIREYVGIMLDKKA